MSNDEKEPSTFEEAFERYVEYRTRFERVENEFDEYQQSSLNYEQELEIQLKELDNQTHRLQQELFLERSQNEQYRERSEQTIKQFDKRFDQVQEELNGCKNLNEKLTLYIRELEQTNDDLERSKRTLLDSLSTFEIQLNRALEQNALLEDELDEKQQLNDTVQRLRDETRDLREELDALHQTQKPRAMTLSETPIINSNRMQSILSEAATAASTTLTRDCNNQPDLANGNAALSTSSHEHTPRLPLAVESSRKLSMSLETGPDYHRPLSSSTRLESLKLISGAFRHFSAIESTLTGQRKHSQLTSAMNFSRSRFNSTASSNFNKTNESTII